DLHRLLQPRHRTVRHPLRARPGRARPGPRTHLRPLLSPPMTPPLQITRHPPDPDMRSLGATLRRHDEWQRVFNRILEQEHAISGGRILDIGAGTHPPKMDLIRE